MAFKLTIIGAGSLTFARTLFTDIMHVPELRGIEVAFTDISQENLDMVTRLCQRDLDANGIPTKIFATTDRREALKGARYIVNCVRVGGLEAFESDIDIPLRYGVDQCVGDTLCIGGIMYGQRGIAAMLDFCRDIREVAEPNALLLNYSNPMAMMTWASIKYGGVRTIGLCHGEIHGEMQIADVLGLKDRSELDVTCAGLNHQTWYISVKHKGEEMIGKLLEGFEKHETYKNTEKVRIDVLRRFGYYSTESNGHLSEYVSWYRKRPNEIEKWIDLSSWINGETGGYLRETRENRNWFETEFPKLMDEPPRDYTNGERSSEHGSYIIEALETGRVYRGHFNVVNNGAISNLPDDIIVEVPCYVDGNGVSVPKVGDLPLGCAAVCSQSAWVQRLAVEAAVNGDAELLKQAALLDPLTGAVCNPPEVWQMVDEMLIAQAQWLPQYAEAIAEARTRFAEGDLIPTNEGYRGAVRVREKTVEEVSAERKEREERAKRE